MNKKSFNMIQISDTHLFAGREGTLVGRNTWNSFSAVKELVLANHPKPDIIIHTGDVSQDYSDDSYQALAEALRCFECPVYWIPGNHDRMIDMEKIFSNTQLSMDKEIITENWHIVLLNSSVDGKVYGQLSEAEYHRLSEAVGAYPDKYFMIFLHHHPVPINVSWLDRLGLQHPERFLGLAHQHSLLRAIVCGHIHLVFEKQEGEVKYLSTPSTCIQFSPNNNQFALDRALPGYRWFELQEDGSLNTGVNRLQFYEDDIDYESKGY